MGLIISPAERPNPTNVEEVLISKESYYIAANISKHRAYLLKAGGDDEYLIPTYREMCEKPPFMSFMKGTQCVIIKPR
jgi:hypothetical protein